VQRAAESGACSRKPAPEPDLRTAEPVLKRHVDSKQEKAKSSSAWRVIRAPGSRSTPSATWCSASRRSTCR
jgi:hypothetical protein